MRFYLAVDVAIDDDSLKPRATRQEVADALASELGSQSIDVSHGDDYLPYRVEIAAVGDTGARAAVAANAADRAKRKVR